MFVNTQSFRKPGFYAGLYMRTKKKVRFWGWGRPEFSGTSATEVERPWAALADWLRVAHSLAGTNRQTALSEANAHTESLTATPVVETPATEAAQRQNRKLRFICDRHFIGLVYR
jgi:hypothetical protein